MEEKGARDAAYANAAFQWSNPERDWPDGHYAQDGECNGKPMCKKLDGSGGFYKLNGYPVQICAWSRAHCTQRAPATPQPRTPSCTQAVRCPPLRPCLLASCSTARPSHATLPVDTAAWQASSSTTRGPSASPAKPPWPLAPAPG